MIAKQYANALAEDMLSIDWVERYGGLTQLVSNGAVTVPVAEDVDPVECFDTQHYKELIPDNLKKGIVYIEEAGDADMAQSGNGLHKFSQKLRMVVWINLPKAGFASNSYAPIYPAVRLLTVRPLNVDGINLLSVNNISVLQRETTIKSVFGRYNYQNDIFALSSWPYAVFAVEFTLSGSLNQKCLPVNAGGIEIVCP